jgi:hypothetical protein
VGFYQYGLDTVNLSGTSPTSVPTAQSFPVTLTGLASSTTYYYRIAASNTGGTNYGAFTNFTTAWVPLPPTPLSPGTPTDTTNTTANFTPLFSWIGTNQASSYDLIISQYPYGNANIVFTASVGGTSYQVPGGILQTGTKYAWYMVSFNSLGDESAASASLYFQTPAPPAVQTLSVTNKTLSGNGGTADLRGLVNPNGLPTFAWFEYGKTTNSLSGTTMTAVASGTAALVYTSTTTTIKNGSYFYRIDASNSLGTAYGSFTNFTMP